MVEAQLAGRADIHRRAFADGFDAAENFDRSGVVLVAEALRGRSLFFTHESRVSSEKAACWLCSGRRSRGVADPCLPIGPALANSFVRAGTRRVASELHPVPIRTFSGGRGEAAISPAEGERFSLAAAAIFGSLVLAQAGLARRKLGANCLPSERNM